ncbi:MAG: coenzyme F420 hydrogenase/dehydrogenase beta subunit N-terminal domain-containing protein [Verrucomicrobiota bacterium]
MSPTEKNEVCEQLTRQVIRAGLCTGCGACVGMDASGESVMEDTPTGPVPKYGPHARLEPLAFAGCPGKGLNYPQLYTRFYGALPKNWLTGPTFSVRIGHASDETVRRNGASGGVLSQVLIYLLEQQLIDAAIVVRQGLPTPEKARAVFAVTRQEILDAAQSVYIPVATLDKLRELEPGKRYAMTCLPDQAATLRFLQLAGDAHARQIRYALGPYTGTALCPAAIRSFLRSCGVSAKDGVANLKWRAGEWPGYLEIQTQSGRVIRSNKFYYNYLIPFFITRNSLLNMDFANEFCDLSVGDAWSPQFERAGGGHSVITTRTRVMEEIVARMAAEGRLTVQPVEELKATEMHGHMIDFKKRGGYIRNRMRKFLGQPAADFGMKPSPLPVSRVLVEMVISGIFILAGTSFCRWLVERVPERFIGPVFNRLRLGWKAASKPTKRKGLGSLRMIPTQSNP